MTLGFVSIETQACLVWWCQGGLIDVRVRVAVTNPLHYLEECTALQIHGSTGGYLWWSEHLVEQREPPVKLGL